MCNFKLNDLNTAASYKVCLSTSPCKLVSCQKSYFRIGILQVLTKGNFSFVGDGLSYGSVERPDTFPFESRVGSCPAEHHIKEHRNVDGGPELSSG